MNYKKTVWWKMRSLQTGEVRIAFMEELTFELDIETQSGFGHANIGEMLF